MEIHVQNLSCRRKLRAKQRGRRTLLHNLPHDEVQQAHLLVNPGLDVAKLQKRFEVKARGSTAECARVQVVARSKNHLQKQFEVLACHHRSSGGIHDIERCANCGNTLFEGCTEYKRIDAPREPWNILDDEEELLNRSE